MKQILTAVMGGLLLSASGIQAAELGDPAPELKIDQWVKGEPVKVNGDGIYVVEFWATWCGPCKISIPHLTEMQKQFKNVSFVGITDEKEPVVKKFVAQMGDKMAYRVAIDEDHETSKNYMEAFHENGIPHAFVVQNKKIVWHGHPMDHLEETLEEITAGKYDLAKAKTRSHVQQLYAQFQEAAYNGQESQADKLAAQIEAEGKDVTGIFPNDKFDPDMEKKQLHIANLRNEFGRAIAEGNDAKAGQLGKTLKQLAPEIDLNEFRGRVEMSKLVQDYVGSVGESADPSKAGELGSKLAEKLKGHADMANQIAWGILTSEAVKNRDLPLAVKISKQACEDSQWKDAQIIDTYARALFDTGRKQEAIDYEKKALAMNTDENAKPVLEENLKKYEAAK